MSELLAPSKEVNCKEVSSSVFMEVWAQLNLLASSRVTFFGICFDFQFLNTAESKCQSILKTIQQPVLNHSSCLSSSILLSIHFHRVIAPRNSNSCWLRRPEGVCKTQESCSTNCQKAIFIYGFCKWDEMVAEGGEEGCWCAIRVFCLCSECVPRRLLCVCVTEVSLFWPPGGEGQHPQNQKAD